jgi:hypothetical protein
MIFLFCNQRLCYYEATLANVINPDYFGTTLMCGNSIWPLLPVIYYAFSGLYWFFIKHEAFMFGHFVEGVY